jgi:hypothetical protein
VKGGEEVTVKSKASMIVEVHGDLELNPKYGNPPVETPVGLLECGAGAQRLAWVARVAAQRFGSEGLWCSPHEQVGRPKEYIPGRIFLDSGQEVDPDSTLSSLAYQLQEQVSEDTGEPMLLRIRVQLWATPASGLPTLSAGNMTARPEDADSHLTPLELMTHYYE